MIAIDRVSALEAELGRLRHENEILRGRRVNQRSIEPVGVPQVYGYGRISDPEKRTKKDGGKREVESLGIDGQKDIVQRFYAWKFADTAAPKWAGGAFDKAMFIDAGISGGVPFADRPAGKELDERLCAGDHVLISKLDRAFRDLFDCLSVLRRWSERGIVIYLVSENLCWSKDDYVGQAFIQLLGVFAQLERARISLRCREAKAIAKAQGKVFAAQPRPGYRYLGPKGARREVLDPAQTEAIDLIVHLRDVEKLIYYRIFCELRRRKILWPKGRYRRLTAWSVERVRYAYKVRKAEPATMTSSPLPASPSPEPAEA